MAHTTHLTISTCDRVRLEPTEGDDTDGEGSEGHQEVQVSVTYALDAGDTDLVSLAERKAPEVKMAHKAVWNRIGAFSGRSNGSGSECRRCSGRHESDQDREKDDYSDDDPLAGLPHDGDDPFGGGPAPAGAARLYPAATKPEAQNGNSVPPQGGRYLPDASPQMNGNGSSEPTPEPDAEPLTGPQKILIRSRANKIGLTAYALEGLLYQQFKVWRVERLTKDQAASVLAALERDLKEKKNAEKNGKEGTSHADSNGRAATA